jgi:hypothetical protein
LKEEFGDARAALRFQVRIVAVPLKWRGFRDAAQSAVGHAIAAQLRCFQVPRYTVNVIVGMAGGAGELALEAEFGVVEELLALT